MNRLQLAIATLALISVSLASERERAQDAYRSYTGGLDPALFHYGEMESALNAGNIKLASAHATERTQHLTLTDRRAVSAANLIKRIEGLEQIIEDLNERKDELVGNASASGAKRDSDGSLLLDSIRCSVVRDLTIEIPLRTDFSTEIRALLEESAASFQSLEKSGD